MIDFASVADRALRLLIYSICLSGFICLLMLLVLSRLSYSLLNMNDNDVYVSDELGEVRSKFRCLFYERHLKSVQTLKSSSDC